MEWQRFLDLEWQTPTADQYYLAQIAAECRRQVVRAPNAVRPQDLLLEFRPSKEVERDRARRSKAAWFGALGLKEGGAC